MKKSSVDPLSGRIFFVRGQRVVLDRDLARLFGVTTMAFNQAVRRNWKRFPQDFIGEITHKEYARLISQTVISNGEIGPSRGGRRKAALAFTEHGAIMAATILRSAKAVAMSVYVVRAFVKMREDLAANQTVLRRLAEIDRTLLEHGSALSVLWKRLQPLLSPPPEAPHREIGFHVAQRKSLRGCV